MCDCESTVGLKDVVSGAQALTGAKLFLCLEYAVLFWQNKLTYNVPGGCAPRPRGRLCRKSEAGGSAPRPLGGFAGRMNLAPRRLLGLCPRLRRFHRKNVAGSPLGQIPAGASPQTPFTRWSSGGVHPGFGAKLHRGFGGGALSLALAAKAPGVWGPSLALGAKSPGVWGRSRKLSCFVKTGQYSSIDA